MVYAFRISDPDAVSASAGGYPPGDTFYSQGAAVYLPAAGEQAESHDLGARTMTYAELLASQKLHAASPVGYQVFAADLLPSVHPQQAREAQARQASQRASDPDYYHYSYEARNAAPAIRKTPMPRPGGFHIYNETPVLRPDPFHVYNAEPVTPTPAPVAPSHPSLSTGELDEAYELGWRIGVKGVVEPVADGFRYLGEMLGGRAFDGVLDIDLPRGLGRGIVTGVGVLGVGVGKAVAVGAGLAGGIGYSMVHPVANVGSQVVLASSHTVSSIGGHIIDSSAQIADSASILGSGIAAHMSSGYFHVDFGHGDAGNKFAAACRPETNSVADAHMSGGASHVASGHGDAGNKVAATFWPETNSVTKAHMSSGAFHVASGHGDAGNRVAAAFGPETSSVGRSSTVAVCPCGSAYKEGSRFCNRCGQRRPEVAVSSGAFVSSPFVGSMALATSGVSRGLSASSASPASRVYARSISSLVYAKPLQAYGYVEAAKASEAEEDFLPSLFGFDGDEELEEGPLPPTAGKRIIERPYGIRAQSAYLPAPRTRSTKNAISFAPTATHSYIQPRRDVPRPGERYLGPTRSYVEASRRAY